MKKRLWAGLTTVLMMLGVTGVSSATTIATMDLTNWSGGSNVTREVDGIKLTGTLYDTNYAYYEGPSSTLIWTSTRIVYNKSDDFRDATINFKFMVSGAVEAANVGLFTGTTAIDSRYGPDTYNLHPNQWYYSTLTVSPNLEYTSVLSQGGYAPSGGTVLNTLTRTLTQDTYDHLANAQLSAVISPISQLEAGFQWMKVGEVSYDTTPTQTPLPGAVWLLGSGLIALTGTRRNKKA